MKDTLDIDAWYNDKKQELFDNLLEGIDGKSTDEKEKLEQEYRKDMAKLRKDYDKKFEKLKKPDKKALFLEKFIFIKEKIAQMLHL